MPELRNSKRPEAVVTIVNRKGLHARASAKFVKLAESFDAEITVTRDGQTVGGTSIMGLMMLAAGPGSTLHITAEGPEGPDALEALVTLVETGFDEELADGLAGCERQVFVTSHAAFGYLAERYGLEMVGISGLSPAKAKNG